MNQFDMYYYSLLGELVPEEALAGVENVFVDGSECMQLSEQIYNARRKICEMSRNREIEDLLEKIDTQYAQIQKILCRKMFYYGSFAEENL